MADPKPVSEADQLTKSAIFHASLKGSNLEVWSGCLDTNSFDGSLILRQFNTGDENAIQDLEIARAGTGQEGKIYITRTSGQFNPGLVSIFINQSLADFSGAIGYMGVEQTLMNTIRLLTEFYRSGWVYEDVNFGKHSLLIINRIYGENMTIVSAETSASGGSIYITFSKDIHPNYFTENAGIAGFTFSGGKNLAGFTMGPSPNILRIELDANYTHNDSVSFSYDNTQSEAIPDSPILSVEYGKVTNVTDFAVTNNVPG